MRYFNSRPREGGDPSALPYLPISQNFNSRPREGGDTYCNIPEMAYNISIHAPAKGATPTHPHHHRPNRFQFTPPRRGRLWVYYIYRSREHFNSRPREGGDTALAQNEAKTEKFQFTPPRRGRPGWKATWKNVKSFQFTPPRRGRPSSFGNSTISPVNFNSRPREGGDANVAPTAGKDGRFQFTPPRRGRPASYKIICRLCDISIHAPAKGATFPWCYLLDFSWNFNSRPREGGDITEIYTALTTRNISIHAPAKGATCLIRLFSIIGAISIHAPAKGATALRWGSVTLLIFQFTPPRRGRRVR